jgi:hypothetical protein
MPMTARLVLVGLAAAMLLTLPACGGSTHSAPEGASAEADVAAENACPTVDVRLLDLDTQSDGEPRVRIPQPPGWERFTDMDSEMIRAALVNKSLTADGFTPNVVYSLDVIGEKIEPQKAFEMGRGSLKGLAGATDMKVTEHTQCGLPAETVRYTISMPPEAGPHPAVVRSVVTSSGEQTYIVNLTIQSKRPDDPTYQRDSETILNGLQVLPPAHHS